jgi:hypothetical protein
MTSLLWSAVLLAIVPAGQIASFSEEFTLTQPAEVVATIGARCGGCDWGARGREAIVFEIRVDGEYSQHLVLTRGAQPSSYRVMLGALQAGRHEIVLARDAGRSSPNAGGLGVGPIEIASYGVNAPEHAWLSRAPFLRARPGSLERFSDVPLLMYAERDVPGEAGGTYRYQYTVVFTNEDGGTPADRLMATWGRTTDIEFVYGLTDETRSREMLQAEGHRWIAFDGPHAGTHPVLWVATENNMFADRGTGDAIQFAPAPELIDLSGRSREMVMDAQPWTYAVAAAEALREGRIDPAAPAGSGKIPDPRRYAIVEACAEVADAVLAFDIGVRDSKGQITWHATDRGESGFRIARGGCFRAGAPLPEGMAPGDITALRVRAFPRSARPNDVSPPATNPRVVLRRINRIVMLDPAFVPQDASIVWSGELAVTLDGNPAVVPVR